MTLDSHNTLLTVDQALEQIAAALTPISGSERKPLRDALDRILAEAVCSPLNVPGHTNSAMDGYAINSRDLPAEGLRSRLTVIGSSFAGSPFDGTVKSAQAVRIMTGAVIPEGSDTVIMQEACERDGDTLTIGSQHRSGENVRHIGDDIAVGSIVLQAGKRISPAELGLLASLGVAEIPVRRRLRVATFSTGDELCSIGEPLHAGQIYDSNRYAMHGLLTRIGAEVIDMGVIRDQRSAVKAAFIEAAKVADVVLTSGGVSVGDADYIKEILNNLGQVGFWKVAMKPGKPLAFGSLGSTLFFGLPGNPVSVMATFYQIVQPSLKRLMGETVTAPLTIRVACSERLKKRPGRVDFQRGIIEQNPDGALVVRSTGSQGSHILSSMSLANCFIVLPLESGDIEAGSLVEVQPFEALT